MKLFFCGDICDLDIEIRLSMFIMLSHVEHGNWYRWGSWPNNSQRKVKPKVVFIATEDEIIEYEEKYIAMNLNYLCGLSKNLWNEE